MCAQLCPTLCDPVDYSLPGSSLHGIFQARILEWVAISYSRVSSKHRDQTLSLASPALTSPEKFKLHSNKGWGGGRLKTMNLQCWSFTHSKKSFLKNLST